MVETRPWSWAASWGLAAILMTIGLAKLGSHAVLSEYLGARLGFSDSLAAVAAWGIGAVECLLGLAALWRPWKSDQGAWMGLPLAVLAIAGASVVLALTDPPQTRCGCFGRLSQATQGRRLIVAAALAMLAMQLLPRGRFKQSVEPGERGAPAAVRAVSVVAAASLAAWALLTDPAVTASEQSAPELAPQRTPEPPASEALSLLASPPPTPPRNPAVELPPAEAPTPAATQTDSPSQRPRVTGMVIGSETRAPVRGALVLGGTESGPDGVAPLARTDGAGQFALEAEQVGTPTAWLWALAEGYVPRGLNRKLHGVKEALRFELEPGESIDGTVVDVTGRPVQGARVFCTREANRFAWPLHPAQVFPSKDPGNTAVSSADGKFSVRGLWPGTVYEVRVLQSGWEHLYESAPPLMLAGARGVDLRVAPVFELIVRVAGEGDAHRTGPVRIEVMHGPGLELTGPGVRFTRDEAPAPDARFRYRRSGSGEALAGTAAVMVEVASPGFEPYRSEVALTPGSVTDHTLVLKPAGEGRPRKLPVSVCYRGGRPFDGSLALLVASAGTPVCEQHVRVVGGHVVEGLLLPPGQYMVRPGGWGAAGQWWSVAGPSMGLTVEEGSPVRGVQIELAGAPVHLRVTSESGVRLHGYDVQLRAEETGKPMGFIPLWETLVPPAPAEVVPGHASPDGILWLPPGAHVLVASVPGVGMGSARFDVQADGTPIECEIKVREGPWIDVRRRTDAVQRHAR